MKKKLEYKEMGSRHYIVVDEGTTVLAEGMTKKFAKKLISSYNSHEALVEALTVIMRDKRPLNMSNASYDLMIYTVCENALAAIKEAK